MRRGYPVDGREESEGPVRVLGGRPRSRVFGPLRLAGAPSLDLWFLSRYNAALEKLRSGDRSAAVAQFREVAETRPADHLVPNYLDDLAAPGWDGVFSLEGK